MLEKLNQEVPADTETKILQDETWYLGTNAC